MTHLEAHLKIKELEAEVFRLEGEVLRLTSENPPKAVIPEPPMLLDMMNAYDYPKPMPEELIDGGINMKPGLKIMRRMQEEEPAKFMEMFLAMTKDHLRAQAQAAEGVEKARLEKLPKAKVEQADGPDVGTGKALEVIEELITSFEGSHADQV